MQKGIPVVVKALKDHYLTTFSKTKTSPLDDKSFRKLDQIFVNLSLFKGSTSDQRDIEYNEAIRMMDDDSNIVRIVFVGEAGVGKTTLLTKIAYDWASGIHLGDIDLMLFVPLREAPVNTQLRDILKMYVSRGIVMDLDIVEAFIRNNPKRVVLLLDGLDEYKGDISKEDPDNALTAMMRGDEMKHTSVLLTTRPWKVAQITGSPTVSLRFTRIGVKGFKKQDVKEYVKKFFIDDHKSSASLIQLIHDESLVAQHMAPYPIFCSMLCNVWKEDTRRETIKTLETFSQLFDEMVFSLTEHWLSKTSNRNYRKQWKKSLKEIDKVAFTGLLNNRLVFDEQAFAHCKDAMERGCEIGVLSAEKRFAQDQESGRRDISFPHKLFQEYLGGLYLASLQTQDVTQFWRYMHDTVLEEYMEFRYLIYFTVAQCKETGHGGESILEALCSRVKDDEFLMDVVFESHDESSLTPIVKHLNKSCTELKFTQRLQMLQKHTWSGYLFTLTACGKDMVGQGYLLICELYFNIKHV